MITLLPVIVLLVFILIVVVMPWHKPHPNHVFLFELVESLVATRRKQLPISRWIHPHVTNL